MEGFTLSNLRACVREGTQCLPSPHAQPCFFRTGIQTALW